MRNAVMQRDWCLCISQYFIWIMANGTYGLWAKMLEVRSLGS